MGTASKRPKSRDWALTGDGTCFSCGWVLPQQQTRQWQWSPQGQCAVSALDGGDGKFPKAAAGAQNGVAMSITAQAVKTIQRMVAAAKFIGRYLMIRPAGAARFNEMCTDFTKKTLAHANSIRGL